MHQTVLTAVVWLVLIRCVWLFIGLIRLIPVHRRARTKKWGPIELFTFAELPVFFALAFYLYSRAPVSPSPGAPAVLGAVAGALLALAGVLISLWAFYTTYRTGIVLDLGHFVKKEHGIVSSGAYRFVRNPLYLGVFLIWLGAAIAFQSFPVLLIAVFYVIPTYLLYIRSEEAMLLQEFGDEYQRYRDRVGRIFPRLNRFSWVASPRRLGRRRD